MRPETVFILSSLDVRTLAEFPPVLDPCVNEALRNEKVINTMAADDYLMASEEFREITGAVMEREHPEVLAALTPAWECKTDGVGYSCTSPSPDKVTLRKRPGCGGVRASIRISVPSTGGKIEFGYSATVASWAFPIYVKINGDEVLTFIGASHSANVGISGVRGSGSKTIDMSGYAGKVVTFEIIGEDRLARWCVMSDHNFDITVRDFKFTPVAPPTPIPVVAPPVVAPVPVAPRVEVSADDLRKADVDVREAVAKAIITVAVAEAGEISTPTPIPGVVMPKPETGLPMVPITIPTMVLKIPEAEIEGANTIEFQELIPGIKPPAIPLLIPGLEKLPLLPGWTIRNPEGRVVSEGARIPTLPPGIIGIPIPEELPGEALGPGESLAILGDEYLAPEEEYYPEEAILEETGMEIAPTVPAEMLGGNMLELGNEDGDEDMVLSVELEEESLEL